MQNDNDDVRSLILFWVIGSVVFIVSALVFVLILAWPGALMAPIFHTAKDPLVMIVLAIVFLGAPAYWLMQSS